MQYTNLVKKFFGGDSELFINRISDNEICVTINIHAEEFLSFSKSFEKITDTNFGMFVSEVLGGVLGRKNELR